MPVYCYVCDECGATREEFFHPTEDRTLPDCAECESPMRRDYSAEVNPRRDGEVVNSLADHHSLAFQFLPSEAKEAMEKVHRAPGCANVELDRKGRVVTHSIAERRAFIKHHNATYKQQVVDHDD